MWNLAVSLPLMVVPHTDEEWECFLLLLDVLQICVSPVVSVDLVAYLTLLIEMYLSAFGGVYFTERNGTETERTCWKWCYLYMQPK